MSDAADSRIEALEMRLRTLEDRLEIYQLLATYGPSVDSLSGDTLAGMWLEDAVYDAGGADPYVGRQGIADLLAVEPHQTYVGKGCAHVISLPHVTVNGDRAVATGHSRVYLNQGDHWRVERASANRWDLVRTAEGWQVARRLNRPLNGTEESRAVLRSGLEEA